MSNIHFYNDEGCAYRLRGKRAVAAWLYEVISAEGFAVDEINYIFCTRERHLEMNRTYLGHDWPTDVITFEGGEWGVPSLRGAERRSNPATIISGEIYIDPQTVRENAKRFDTTARREMLRVVVHGVLHLCGHPDKAPAEEEAMHALEDRYLEVV